LHDAETNEEVKVLRSKCTAGFTLYELMVTLAVASVILSFGVPGFQNFVQNSRSVTHSNDLVTALNLARSEATRRGAPVDICASTDGTTCSGSTDWSTGWVVRAPTGEVLRAWPARSGGASVLTGNLASIQFQARGSLAAGTAPQLALQLPRCNGTDRRNITVNVAGRIAVNRVACL
jgi:type IV fimbrial biogenesis protein FimT